MKDPLAHALAQSEGKGYVIAPAGFGKTHLIASAVSLAPNCQLVLTHTYAGVHSIKQKMRLLKVPSSKYHVDTIASWALRQCLSFPKTSGWTIEAPTSGDWKKLYKVCAKLLDHKFMQRVLQCSYGGIYVDEYQDCNNSQHELIEKLAEFRPCRILGDPLQAIFSFDKKEPPIDWERDIFPRYTLLGKLEEPWRWKKAGAHELGEWLREVRDRLDQGLAIPLTGELPKGVVRKEVDIENYMRPNRFDHFLRCRGSDESFIVIFSGDPRSKNKGHKLAQALKGHFSSMEEVEGKTLHSFINKLEGCADNQSKLTFSIDFLKKCCNGVNDVLHAATKKGQAGKLSKVTKYPDILTAANDFLASGSYGHLHNFFRAVNGKSTVTVFRRDLLYRLMSVFRIHSEDRLSSLVEAANKYQQDFRHAGRPTKHGKLIGTTLLVKGLEYDHATVLQAEAMNVKDLYVALTRGAKSVTILTLADSVPN